VLILAGDHIYKMDYGPMIAFHVERGADITIGAVEVPVEKAREYGVLSVDAQSRVTHFTEKPAEPDGIPGRPEVALASMGIYIFNTQLLERLLVEDAADPNSRRDFGRNIIPNSIGSRSVYAYPFQDVQTRAQSYWRDVGTLDAYYEANLELIYVRPDLNIYDESWPIWTYQLQKPPAKFVLDDFERRGFAVNSMVSGGCIISGAAIDQSLLFSDVHVEERSRVHRSVVLPNVEIGRGCEIHNAIIDEGCAIPDGFRIGVDRELDAERFEVTDGGVVLVTPDMIRDVW
jgi:glucose-1-phosphate adenylyltransferase